MFKNEHRRAQDDPKTGRREPTMIQNEARSDPTQPQEESKRVSKVNPNRNTKKGPNQDDPKTVLDPPGTDEHSSAASKEVPLG